MDNKRSRGSVYQFLLDNDLNDVAEIRQYRHAGIMHNKIAIIDGRILFTGSYNWSKAAEETNEENLLEFINEEEIIEIYRERLDYLWDDNGDK